MYNPTPMMMARDSQTPKIADCPTLAVWFQGEEQTGAESIVDAVGGLTVPVNSIERLSNGNGIIVDTNVPPLVGGSWPAIGGNNFAVVSASKISGAQLIMLGSTGQKRIQLGTGFGNRLEDDSNVEFAAGFMTNAVAQSQLITVEPGSATGLNTYAGSIKQSNTTDITSIATMALGDFAQFDADEFYMLMLFIFAGVLPETIVADSFWMADQARLNGNKVIHPNCVKYL